MVIVQWEQFVSMLSILPDEKRSALESLCNMDTIHTSYLAKLESMNSRENYQSKVISLINDSFCIEIPSMGISIDLKEHIKTNYKHHVDCAIRSMLYHKCFDDIDCFLKIWQVDISEIKTKSQMNLLEQVITYEYVDAITYLLNKKIDVNYQDEKMHTALMLAAKQGYLIGVKHLIAAQAKINMGNQADSTALILATQGDHLQVVEYLFQNGADINYQNWLGMDALMTASSKGNVKIVEYLLRNGADPKQKDAIGCTAFMIAAKNGNIKVVQYLYDNTDVDVNECNFQGDTALILASEFGHILASEYLVDKHAKIDHKNFSGATAISKAVTNGHKYISRSLNEVLEYQNQLLKSGKRIKVDHKNDDTEDEHEYIACQSEDVAGCKNQILGLNNNFTEEEEI